VPNHTLGERTRAWAVHLFTASGAIVGLVALHAAAAGQFRESVLWMLVALSIDSVDGMMARRARVSEVVPGIDGRRLDDIVDYLNYVIVPIAFLGFSGAIESTWVAAAPILASAYGFSQADAKTEDHFFVGFPSYWNVVALYVWWFEFNVVVTAILLVALAAAVFIPLKYVYPSRMQSLWWSTNAGAALWVGLVAIGVAFPEATAGWHLIEISLLYPAWYVGLSFWLGGLAHRQNREDAAKP
jgi:phosphatidylcholine synthase